MKLNANGQETHRNFFFNNDRTHTKNQGSRLANTNEQDQTHTNSNKSNTQQNTTRMQKQMQVPLNR